MINKRNDFCDDGYNVTSLPFDPRDINIEMRNMLVVELIDKLNKNKFDLSPDFQRRKDLWDAKKQSRFIESLLIRIPIPFFYFDVTDDETIIVVDGVQRLSSLMNFIVLNEHDPNKLRLTELEYLTELNGKKYEELPASLKRRLGEQTLQVYLIKQGTPDVVRNSIFERINTGGLTFTPAEIRKFVYRGIASDFIEKLADTAEFVKVTHKKVNTKRMMDRDLISRFLAFYLFDHNMYSGNMENQLVAVMEKLKNDHSLNLSEIEMNFKHAADLSEQLFGERAFLLSPKSRRVNKNLFEVLMVQLSKLNEKEMKILLAKKLLFLKEYQKLLENRHFINSLTRNTESTKNVLYRHECVETVLKKVIDE